MVAREWKPGDVAVLDVGSQVKAVFVARCFGKEEHGAGGHWHLASGGWSTQGEDLNARPVVVIDPEDREQVEALTHVFYEVRGLGEPQLSWGRVENMQAALRSLITPPKPERPTGWGSVVEDDTGAFWTQYAPEADVWINYVEGKRQYAEIAAVRVVTPGVTA